MGVNDEIVCGVTGGTVVVNHRGAVGRDCHRRNRQRSTLRIGIIGKDSHADRPSFGHRVRIRDRHRRTVRRPGRSEGHELTKIGGGDGCGCGACPGGSGGAQDLVGGSSRNRVVGSTSRVVEIPALCHDTRGCDVRLIPDSPESDKESVADGRHYRRGHHISRIGVHSPAVGVDGRAGVNTGVGGDGAGHFV